MTTPASGQSASMWFSVPQNVTNGFNAWFQFKITPSSPSGNTADGLAFVIQNSLGSGTDATSGYSVTGSGITGVGSGADAWATAASITVSPSNSTLSATLGPQRLQQRR